MRKLLRIQSRVIVLLLLLALLSASRGGSDYNILSLREGIGHFSIEYSPQYQVLISGMT
jgi:hypothetical protein